MTESFWWIQAIDWRISSGIIFSIILLLWGPEGRRKGFYGRWALSLAVLALSSGLMRYGIEIGLVKPVLVASAHSLYLYVLTVLYLFCHAFCYEESPSELLYKATLALTIYRVAWNVNKVITIGLVQFPLPWPIPKGSLWLSLSAYALYYLVCLICQMLYAKTLKRSYPFALKDSRLLFHVVLGFQILLELSYRLVNPDDGSGVMFLFFFTSLMYGLMSYALILMLQSLYSLRHDNEMMENFIKSKQKYYEISREGILSLQTKCHDLKHQIKLIRSADGKNEFDRYVDRLEESIDEYNTVIETGNKTLDIVLTEKNILCLGKGIKFTYMVDGRLFCFLSEMDTLALFGNIMDNAIESLGPTPDKDRAYIRMKAAKRGDRIILYVENSFETPLKYHNGVLVTTKDESRLHGFGLRSISDIAQRYGGALSINAEDRVFKLTVTLAWVDRAPETAEETKAAN